MPKSTPKVANLNSPQMAHQIINGPNGQMFLVPANNNPKVHKIQFYFLPRNRGKLYMYKLISCRCDIKLSIDGAACTCK